MLLALSRSYLCVRISFILTSEIDIHTVRTKRRGILLLHASETFWKAKKALMQIASARQKTHPKAQIDKSSPNANHPPPPPLFPRKRRGGEFILLLMSHARALSQRPDSWWTRDPCGAPHTSVWSPCKRRRAICCESECTNHRRHIWSAGSPTPDKKDVSIWSPRRSRRSKNIRNICLCVSCRVTEATCPSNVHLKCIYFKVIYTLLFFGCHSFPQ